MNEKYVVKYIFSKLYVFSDYIIINYYYNKKLFTVRGIYELVINQPEVYEMSNIAISFDKREFSIRR